MTRVGGKWKHKAETGMKGNLTLGLPEPEIKKKKSYLREKITGFFQHVGHSKRLSDTLVNKDLILSELECRLEPVLHRLCNCWTRLYGISL